MSIFKFSIIFCHSVKIYDQEIKENKMLATSNAHAQKVLVKS